MPSRTDIRLDRFDVDGALQETGAELDGVTRGAFLRRAGLAAASLAGTGALMGGLPTIASAAGAPRSDVAILNFALTLEYLEAEFYKQAAGNIPGGPLQELATLVRDHEQAHVDALRKALGSKAVKKPAFDFGRAVTDQPTFVQTAFVLENVGVHAYLGQAGAIKTPALLGAAATIVTVEARHAAAIALLIDADAVRGKDGISPDGAFDVPWSRKRVLKAVADTGFIAA